jgi:hypothetical protein
MIDLSRLPVIIIFLYLFITFPAFCEVHVQHGGSNDPISEALEQYAVNKEIPDEMQNVILTALSFYPELTDISIQFVFKDNIRKAVMQAQPKVKGIFKKKSSRKYVVKISRHLNLTHEKIDISTLPCEVLVGWIGHELGHVIDYKDRNSFSMIKFGLRYVLFKKFIIKAEKNADLYALKHGLGSYIMEAKNFVLSHANIPAGYKAKSKRLYMSPEEFELMIGSISP